MVKAKAVITFVLLVTLFRAPFASGNKVKNAQRLEETKYVTHEHFFDSDAIQLQFLSQLLFSFQVQMAPGGVFA